MQYQFHFLPIGFSKKGFEDLEAQLDDFEMGVKLVEHLTPEIIQQINAVIIDFDKEDLEIAENLTVCRELLPNRPIIGLFNTPIKLDRILSLKKPVNRSEFSLILDKLSGEDIPREHPRREIRAIYSNPDSPSHYPIRNCFQDYLVKAWKIYQKVNQPIELVFLNKPVLVIYDNKVSVYLSEERLNQLCTLTIHDHSMSTTLLSSVPKRLPSEDAIYFIAKIALWSSQGRLPDGVNSTDIVRLVNPEKQYSLPKIEGSHLIRKLWLNESCSLQEAEQVLQVQQPHLFSYFSALYAVDLIEVFSSNRSAKTKPKGKKNFSKRGRLEKKIYKKAPVPNLL